MITTRIIVYGSKDGGKYVTAMKLRQDNPFLTGPYVIKNFAGLVQFMAGEYSLGIITAPSVNHILSKCENINLGSVLFIADPTATEQAGEDLVSELVWNGSSAQETLDKLHSPESMSKAS